MGKSNSLSAFIAHVVTVATLVEVDALKLLTGIVHLVEAGAPIAEVIGGAIGQPEVTAGAIVAENVAKAADGVIEEIKSERKPYAGPEIAGLSTKTVPQPFISGV